jgi:hypothetical protein
MSATLIMEAVINPVQIHMVPLVVHARLDIVESMNVKILMNVKMMMMFVNIHVSTQLEVIIVTATLVIN